MLSPTPTRSKVSDGLERWKALYPTLNGKRLIANYITAGCTQYRAKVQELPKNVEKQLIKQLRTFVWDSDAAPPLALQKLYDPIEEGGIKLVDLEARTEAIMLTWLQSFLKLGPERPKWAFVVDAMINMNISKSGPQPPESARTNILLQTWQANLYQKTTLPTEISNMFQIGKKYGVRISAPQPTVELREALPIWYPIGQNPEKRRVYTSRTCECLQERHGITTAGEARALADLLRDTRHKPRRNCGCRTCKDLRDKVKCFNPHLCAKEAAKLLDNLSAKWDPRSDNRVVRPLTESERRENEISRKKGGPITFDPSYEEHMSIADNFRIFTNEGDAPTPETLKIRIYRRSPHVEIFSASACAQDQTNGPAMGEVSVGGATWVRDRPDLNTTIRQSEDPLRAELDALIRTLHRTPLKYEATVVTKNKLLIKNLTSNLHALEDKNWMDVAHGDLMRSLVETLRRRTGRTHLFLYNHGRHHAGMNTATNMAKEACRRRLTEYEKVKTASDLSLEGARFMALSQADLYQNIRRKVGARQKRVTSRD